jgi:hypothetical protein
MYVPFHDSGSNEEWNQWRNQVSSTTILLWNDDDNNNNNNNNNRTSHHNNFYHATLDRARDQFEKSSVAAHHLLETLQVKGQQVEQQAFRHGTTAFRNFFASVPSTTTTTTSPVVEERQEERGE